MERIVLEVDDSIGKIYQKFTDEGKIKFKEAVSLLLKKSVNAVAISSYNNLLDQLGNEAIANGLTQEKLDELLKTDD